eukprot:8352727-Pyramimonas_sp.AAC.1
MCWIAGREERDEVRDLQVLQRGWAAHERQVSFPVGCGVEARSRASLRQRIKGLGFYAVERFTPRVVW